MLTTERNLLPFSLPQTLYLVIHKDNFIIHADDWPKNDDPLLYYYFMLRQRGYRKITPWPRKFIKMLNEDLAAAQRTLNNLVVENLQNLFLPSA